MSYDRIKDSIMYLTMCIKSCIVLIRDEQMYCKSCALEVVKRFLIFENIISFNIYFHGLLDNVKYLLAYVNVHYEQNINIHI